MPCKGAGFASNLEITAPILGQTQQRFTRTMELGDKGSLVVPPIGKLNLGIFMKATTLLAGLLFAVGSLAGSAYAAQGSHPSNTAKLTYIVNGVTVPNVRNTPSAAAFAQWCNGTCTASTQMPLRDARTNRVRGHVYTWTKPFLFSADGNSFCFSEFAEFALPDGSIYAHSNDKGTCGAFIDPALRFGTHGTSPSALVAAGGDGVVVGGTRAYRGLQGTYTDRLFSELDEHGGGYYDQLFWSLSVISPNGAVLHFED